VATFALSCWQSAHHCSLRMRYDLSNQSVPRVMTRVPLSCHSRQQMVCVDSMSVYFLCKLSCAMKACSAALGQPSSTLCESRLNDCHPLETEIKCFSMASFPALAPYLTLQMKQVGYLANHGMQNIGLIGCSRQNRRCQIRCRILAQK
jgi:hypothetical protein